MEAAAAATAAEAMVDWIPLTEFHRHWVFMDECEENRLSVGMTKNRLQLMSVST